MNSISIQLADDDQPKYLQLFNGIKDLITTGNLKSGEKLPTIRNLSKELGINSVTVVNAYKLLETNKYITAKKGSGFYISKKVAGNEEVVFSSDAGMITGAEVINFASAAPHPSIFPIESFKECINEVLERDKGFAFSYQESNGFRPLRESIGRYLEKAYSIKVENGDYIQVVSGAQQGIDLIGKVLLNPGDYVITETPTYDGAIAVFKSRGARICGVGLEKDGIDLEDLEKKIRICKPKFVYLMTRYQNPTTICYSAEKLKTLIQLAEKYHIYIVEDDSMSELCYEKNNFPALKALDGKNDRVIYLKSFSKILMPGLRIGGMIVPESLIDEFTKIKHTSDISSNGLIQRALDLYFRGGKWDEHITYMKEIYKGKYEFMLGKLDSLKKYGISFIKPNGGLYFWVQLPSVISAKMLYQECKKNGLLFIPSPIFYENAYKIKDNYIRLSFASPTIEQIREGMAILEKCMNHLEPV